MGAGVSKIAPGRNLFRANCAACHGSDGEGNTCLAKSMKVANLHSLVVQKKSDAQLAQVITNGAGDMPSFKDSLSDDQIRALVAYLRALSKKK
jgi:mono/diheme cytochrome c family protein